ncbi:MAG: carbohydrate ABC transporter permease [Bacteroidetes bacterium]|jgi:ABC-type glycerol-3-phosphate transport system permease component|nr:carbohydrate ABC transporter permease [Betaproteobacteria bacterium]MBT6365130.1 carbohydrate ABC transporter permease [Bacteroidota bacterium]|tara:strand:+ start:2301 stop:3119 length:819 start_codon:yes stop_codon:yes gene_type:complete
MIKLTKPLQTLILGIFVIYALTPVYLVILAAMRSEADLFSGPLTMPWPPNWQNFSRVWGDSGFSVFFMNSMKISASVTILVVLCAPPAGYAFAKMKFRGREPMFALFLAGLVVPAPSVIVALYGNLQTLGMIDSHIGVILPQAALLLPFSIFLMRTVMQDVPDELIEASTMDGATPFETFIRVVLPVVRPGIMSLILIVFLFSWQEYLLPLVVLQTETLKPITVGAASLQGRYGVDYGGIAAAGLIAFAPLVVLFLAMQRSFVRGLSAGAVK